MTIISVFAYMCLYIHTNMYVEQINTREHERICPYQILEKNTLNAAMAFAVAIFKNNSAPCKHFLSRKALLSDL